MLGAARKNTHATAKHRLGGATQQHAGNITIISRGSLRREPAELRSQHSGARELELWAGRL